MSKLDAKDLAEEVKDSENYPVEQVRYPVIEIFSSIQGEGAFMGVPVTFVRFKGCNLTCPWCDTKDSWIKGDKQDDVERLSAQEIADKCTMEVIVLTGGEPCMQNLAPLIEALHAKGKFIAIETNGTLPTAEGLDWIVASPKPPEYKIDNNCFFNELKYVVDDNFNPDECVPPDMRQQVGQVWLQPCDYGKGKEEKSQASLERCVELAMKHTYLRVGIQLHKLIGVK